MTIGPVLQLQNDPEALEALEALKALEALEALEALCGLVLPPVRPVAGHPGALRLLLDRNPQPATVAVLLLVWASRWADSCSVA